MSHKVVIIGAGPAGGAAAIRLAQRGIKDVVLLDKDRFPRDKTCGSALSPAGLRIIEELGIGDAVHRLAYPIAGLRLKTPGGRVMDLRTEGAAVILARKHFDNLLVERARDLGVELRDGWKAAGIVEERGRAAGVHGRAGGIETEVRGDWVLCCDGAHSIFSSDPRPRRTISTLMGWWEDFPFEPHMMEMVFDRNLAPLYGWMFPETPERVSIGICMDGEDSDGNKTTRNVREVFDRFLEDHFRDRLRGARQIGRFKGHPISYTTWIDHVHRPGVVLTGEAARITHNATGEGIWQAMQSGVYAAEALADVIQGRAGEHEAMRRYEWRLRQRFSLSFVVGHAFRALLRTPLLDGLALAYNNRPLRSIAHHLVMSWALAGTSAEVHESAPDAPPPRPPPPPPRP